MTESKDIVKKKQDIQTYFSSPACMKHLRESLPKVGITADRIVRILFSAIAQTPKLASCTPKSLFNAIIQCATVGLEPNTALGHAYIIPYGEKATLIFGYKGLIELCRRSKEFASVIACEVYPGDKFELSKGTKAYIKHVPDYDIEYDENELLGCYAVATFKDGAFLFEYMPKHRIDKIRTRSSAAATGPWKSDYAMMARKTVIRRLMHYLPLTIEMAEAVKIDGENVANIAGNDIIVNTMESDKTLKAQDINDKIKSSAKEKKVDPKTDKAKPKTAEVKDVKTEPHSDMAKAPAEEAAQTATHVKLANAQTVTFLQIVESFKKRGISETELCAYFGPDDLFEMDTETGLPDLQKIATDIEGGIMAPMDFKEESAKRFEARMKDAQ